MWKWFEYLCRFFLISKCAWVVDSVFLVAWARIVGEWKDCQWIAGGGVAWMRKRSPLAVVCLGVGQGQLVREVVQKWVVAQDQSVSKSFGWVR